MVKFDDICKSFVDLKSENIMKKIFDCYIEEIYKPTENYNEIIKNKNSIIEKMKLNEEQLKLLEQYDACQHEILNTFVERAYGYGMAIEYRLENELKSII